jgi:hypothetical protein
MHQLTYTLSHTHRHTNIHTHMYTYYNIIIILDGKFNIYVTKEYTEQILLFIYIYIYIYKSYFIVLTRGRKGIEKRVTGGQRYRTRFRSVNDPPAPPSFTVSGRSLSANPLLPLIRLDDCQVTGFRA